MLFYQNVSTPLVIVIHCNSISAVSKFCFLGSVTSTDYLNVKIQIHIGKAATVSSQLRSWVWINHNLSLSPKPCVYKSYVISVHLYCLETWSTHWRLEPRLNTLNFRCLRSILDASCHDHVPKALVMELTRVTNICTMLENIPSTLLLNELAHKKYWILC